VKRLGIIGTMVWDTIYGRGDSAEPVEEWGGIAYALAALEVSLPADWEMVPLIKVGQDLASSANAFLHRLTHRSAVARFIEVPEPNNRVTIRYQAADRRAEQLRGGVPAWEWHELGPLVTDLDALYVNLISGFELTLETAQRLRTGFAGSTYVDLHSLFLAVRADGLRTPRELPDVAEWFACFDAVQVNEDELGLIGDEPLQVAAAAMERGVRLLVVTLAERGAVYFVEGDFNFLNLRTPLGRARYPIRTAKVAAPAVEVRDPTGCGDVFGGAMVAQLVQQVDVEAAVREATALASRNVQFRGATNLQYSLRGAIIPT
jgi:sugar/nucleoside kinase (ribokinase family)